MKTWPASTKSAATKISITKLFHTKIVAQHATKYIPIQQSDIVHSNHLLNRRPNWRDREYREAYMEAAIEQGIAWQIRINRQFRGLTQKQLAEAVGTGQSAISRLEDPSYGAQSLDVLVKIAKHFDCALVVKFASYSELAYASERIDISQQIAIPYEEEMEEFDEIQKNQSTIHEFKSNERSANCLR